MIIDGGVPIEVHLIVERIILDKTINVVNAICGLVAAYFTFNMVYPSSVRPILIFIQHILMGIKDQQGFLSLLTRV